MTNTESTTGPAPAEAVMGEYFAGRVAEARAAVEKAQATLNEAESEAALFRDRGELPPAVGGMRAGWELASWVVGRTTRVATAAMRDRATRGDYDRAKVEQAAVFAWMAEHDYDVPDAYRDKR